MKCFSAAATVVLAAMLCGCQQKADMTPVWQTDLPTTGVHMELSNTDDISFDPAYYAQTREDAFYNNLHEISAVMAEGAPVVTFYGVTADEVKLIYLENIGDYLYVDYDRRKSWITCASTATAMSPTSWTPRTILSLRSRRIRVRINIWS